MYMNQVESLRCTVSKREDTTIFSFSLSLSLSLSLALSPFLPPSPSPVYHETSNITFACCRKRSTVALVVWTPSRDDNDEDEL